MTHNLIISERAEKNRTDFGKAIDVSSIGKTKINSEVCCYKANHLVLSSQTAGNRNYYHPEHQKRP